MPTTPFQELLENIAAELSGNEPMSQDYVMSVLRKHFSFQGKLEDSFVEWLNNFLAKEE